MACDRMFWSICFIFPVTWAFTGEWAGHSKWNHDFVSEQGPQKWNISWPDCSGPQQSPVDIDIGHVWYSSGLLAFDMFGYETIPAGAHWELKNAGHAIHLVLSGDYRIGEGGLQGIYKAVHMEFHWGPTDITGTEHTINGNGYALELQIVHYNMKYNTYDTSLAYEDGLAVLSFLVKAGGRKNQAFTQITKNLDKVAEEGSSVALRPISLFSLLHVNINNYYRYHGSLTIPPCLEIVDWSIFSDITSISDEQMAAFHNLKTTPKNSKHSTSRVSKKSFLSTNGNCRPLQPLSGRTVYSSNPKDANLFNSPVASTLSVITAVFLGFVCILLLISRPLKSIPVALEGHHD